MSDAFPHSKSTHAESMLRVGMLAAEPGMDWRLVHKAARIVNEIFENTIHPDEVILASGWGAFDGRPAGVSLQRDSYNRDSDIVNWATLSFELDGQLRVAVTSRTLDEMSDSENFSGPQLRFETDDLDEALNGFLIPFSQLREDAR